MCDRLLDVGDDVVGKTTVPAVAVEFLRVVDGLLVVPQSLHRRRPEEGAAGYASGGGALFERADHVFRVLGSGGQAGVLDASRMASFIAMETGFSSHDITTIVLGGHGDTMVPLPRFCSINGIPVRQFISEDKLQAIIERTRNGGAEILSLRKTSSAYDAPAAAVATMVDAIANNRRRILPTVALLDGEYGQLDLAMGVPCVLSEQGVERIIDLELDSDEMKLFNQSAQTVREDIARIPA